MAAAALQAATLLATSPLDPRTIVKVALGALVSLYVFTSKGFVVSIMSAER